MPARDLIHDIIARALQNDGWTITNDPYFLSFGDQVMLVDLGAEASQDHPFLGADRGGESIAVEIKSFDRPSVITELYRAIGRYLVYKVVLARVEGRRILYLAVTEDVFQLVFKTPLGKLLREELQINLIVVAPDQFIVTQWIEHANTDKH